MEARSDTDVCVCVCLSLSRPTPLLQPGDIDTVNSHSSTSSNSGPIPVSHTLRGRTPTGLAAQTLLGFSHHIPSKEALARRSSSHGPYLSPPGTQPSTQIPPALQPHVSTTQVGPHPSLFAAAPKKECQYRSCGNPPCHQCRGPCMVRLGLPKPRGDGYLHNADIDLMHHQYRLSVLQWNPGPARRNPPRLAQRLVDGFMRSSCKKPVITCHMSRTNSSRTLVTRTSPSCSTGAHSSPTLQYLLFTKLRQARTRGAW